MSDLVNLKKLAVTNGIVFNISAGVENDVELDLNLPRIIEALNDTERLEEYGIHGGCLAEEKSESSVDEEMLAYYVTETAEQFDESYIISVDSIIWLESIDVIVINAFLGYPDDRDQWEYLLSQIGCG